MDIISEYFACEHARRPYCVTDIHGHMGRWFNFNIPGRNDSDILAAMEQYGIGHIVLSHLKSITGSFIEGNREAIAFAERNPEKISIYIGVNPHYLKDTIEELERWEKHPCMSGIKLHPETHRYSILDKKCAPIFAFASERGLPVLIHVWGREAVKACVEIAQRYPYMMLLMGHSGGPQACEEAVEAAMKTQNLLLDITTSYTPEGMLEWMVQRVGAHRVVFGSDMPFIDAKHTLGRVLHSGLSTEEKRMILSDNAAKLLNRGEGI